MKSGFDFNYIEKYFEQHECKLLEKSYINCATKMKYICVCGKESSISWNGFKNGQRCGCARKKINLLSQNDIKKEVESKDYKFISCNRHRNTYKIVSICKKCKSQRVCELDNFRINGCRFCSSKNKKRKKQKKYDLNYVKDIFLKNGCMLLSDKYKNCEERLDYICSCGAESTITLNCFLQGSRCKKCGIEKMKSSKFDVSNVKKFFENAGCMLLDEYKKSSLPMRYICNCGNQSTISWNNFSKGRRCKNCGIKKRSGENHYEWNKDRRKHNDNFKFRQKCYKLVKMSLDATGKKKNAKTTELLGYNHNQLKEHIKSHPNYKKLKNEDFHIDHIFPIKAFVDHDIYDLKIINCLENLRPLSMNENCAKNAKYDKAKFLEWIRRKTK